MILRLPTFKTKHNEQGAFVFIFLPQMDKQESQFFADDTQLQVSVPPSIIQSAISSLEICLSNIQTWMLENNLNLTMIKRRPFSCAHLPSPFQSPNLLPSPSVAVKSLLFSSARNLGFYIRNDMSVELHTKNVCRSAYSELHLISTVRHLLSVDSTKNTCVRFCPVYA